MATFEYEALDGAGKTKRGLISADNPKAARDNLRMQKLTPIHIVNASDKASAEKAAANHKSFNFNIDRRHLSAKELVLITRQLATLVDTSVPLEEALHAVAQQSDSDKVRRLILSVRDRILEGWRFADALTEDEKSFPPLYRSVVAAGETSGELGKVLDRVATMLEKNRSIRSKALTALIYPATLAVVSLGVIVALMRFVVPKIVEQFEDFSAELPLLTRMVIGVSDVIRDYGVWMVLGFMFAGVAFWQALKNAAFRERFDRALLSLPLIGKLLRGLEGARFGRTLATLYAGGTPLIDSLLGAQRTLMNTYIKNRLDQTILVVREGGGLSQGLMRAAVLPPMMIHMIAAGEKSGKLPVLLDKSAEHLEEEFETSTSVALRLLEPVIVVGMGLIVMVIVLSILLPTLRLNSLASGG